MTKTNNETLAVFPDVHGCITKLEEAVEPLKGSGYHLIFLGDLVDRSPDDDGDMRVLEYIKDLQDNASNYGLARVTVLRGNHEQYLLNLKRKFNENAFINWLYNGGNIEFFNKVDRFLPWIDSFKVKMVIGNYLFVHAGVKPDKELKKQSLSDLLWIREEFLDKENHGLPYVVVHGHTVQQSDEPVVTPYRVSLDLGACFGGPLEPYIITPDMYQGSLKIA